MTLSMTEVIQKARSELNDLTGLEMSSTLSSARNGDEWVVGIEAVEKHSIPDGMDVLVTYEIRMDAEGNILGFRRTKMRKRIDTEDYAE